MIENLEQGAKAACEKYHVSYAGSEIMELPDIFHYDQYDMVGFAVASYRENKMGGLLAQGVGTSMLQVPNIMRHPLIWLPAIISSAVLGPVSTMLLHMTSNATGSGMGTAGFVGQIMTWQVMTQTEDPVIVLIKILMIQIILPAVITLIVSEFMRKHGFIKNGDMKLDI